MKHCSIFIFSIFFLRVFNVTLGSKCDSATALDPEETIDNPDRSLEAVDTNILLGKRSNSDISSSAQISGSLRSRSNGSNSPRRVRFSDSIISSDLSEEEAERKYFEALYSGKESLAVEMRRNGLILSPSCFCYMKVNEILRCEFVVDSLIDHLFNNQPQVFSQFYKNGLNVFIGATLRNIHYFLLEYPKFQRARFNILMEVLRSSVIDVNEAYFAPLKAVRIADLINVSERSGRLHLITKLYNLPQLRYYLNGDGETFLTEAILCKNFDRIKHLVARSDSALFILKQNDLNQNSIDLALKIHLHGLDPDVTLLCSLIPNILFLYNSSHIVHFRGIISRLIEASRLTNNQILLNLLYDDIDEASCSAGITKEFEDLCFDYLRLIDKEI